MKPVSASSRIAMLGYGAIADFHATALTSLGASLVVVAGPNGEEAGAFAERHHVDRVETDPEAAICAPDVDAVVIASPSHVHASQARLALDYRRHVLVEIPLALSAPEATDLASLAAQGSLTLMVCHTLRYWGTLLAAREVIDRDGLLPRSIVARSLGRRHENVGWTGRRRSWIDNLLWHHGGHVVDAVLQLMRAPVDRVTASAGPVWKRSGLPMDYAITLRTTDGGIASIALSYNALVGASDYVVIGDEQTIVIEDTALRTSKGIVYDSGDFAAVERRAILEQDRDFLKSIETGSTPIAAAAAILPAMHVLQAVEDYTGAGR